MVRTVKKEKTFLSERWLVLHPGQYGSGNFGGSEGGTSGSRVALVAVKVVVNMEAVRMVIMDMVMMEAILEARGNAIILSTTTSIFSFWTQETREILEAEALAPKVAEANVLPKHTTKVAVVVLAETEAMAVVEHFN